MLYSNFEFRRVLIISESAPKLKKLSNKKHFSYGIQSLPDLSGEIICSLPNKNLESFHGKITCINEEIHTIGNMQLLLRVH